MLIVCGFGHELTGFIFVNSIILFCELVLLLVSTLKNTLYYPSLMSTIHMSLVRLLFDSYERCIQETLSHIQHAIA